MRYYRHQTLPLLLGRVCCSWSFATVQRPGHWVGRSGRIRWCRSHQDHLTVQPSAAEGCQTTTKRRRRRWQCLRCWCCQTHHLRRTPTRSEGRQLQRGSRMHHCPQRRRCQIQESPAAVVAAVAGAGRTHHRHRRRSRTRGQQAVAAAAAGRSRPHRNRRLRSPPCSFYGCITNVVYVSDLIRLEPVLQVRWVKLRS